MKPVQQMQTFPVCPTPNSLWCFYFFIYFFYFYFPPVWNRIPQKGECEEPPAGLFPEDPDCPGDLWAAAGVPGAGWIFPDEAAQLEPGGGEAGQCLQVAEPQVERSPAAQGGPGGEDRDIPTPCGSVLTPGCVPRSAWAGQGALRGDLSALSKSAPAAAPPLPRGLTLIFAQQ